MAKHKRSSTSNEKPITEIAQRTTRAMQTSTPKGNGRPVPTIPSHPPQMLLNLEGLQDCGLDESQFPFDTMDLDEIAKNNVTKHCLYRIDTDGTYLLGFLSFFNWWMRISEELAECLEYKKGKNRVTQEHLAFKARLFELETAVLARFPAAHLAEPGFLGESYYKPKLELLKAYRALTLFLSETAASLWPAANLHWLTHHA
jgi:hypothetical protein